MVDHTLFSMKSAPSAYYAVNTAKTLPVLNTSEHCENITGAEHSADERLHLRTEHINA
jgi:hypothetical protein